MGHDEDVNSMTKNAFVFTKAFFYCIFSRVIAKQKGALEQCKGEPDKMKCIKCC